MGEAVECNGVSSLRTVLRGLEMLRFAIDGMQTATVDNAEVGLHLKCVQQWDHSLLSIGMTPTTDPGAVECPGSSPFHQILLNGFGMFSCVSTGAVQAISAEEERLESSVLEPTFGQTTTGMIPTIAVEDAICPGGSAFKFSLTMNKYSFT